MIESYAWVEGGHHVTFSLDEQHRIIARVRDHEGDVEMWVTDEEAADFASVILGSVLSQVVPGSREDQEIERLLTWLATVRATRPHRGEA